jgi:branched-subunit amino acid transport protein
VSNWSVWLTVGLIGLLTFATRLSFIATLERFRVPRLVERALRFVPIAVLSALVLPALVLRNGTGPLFLAPSNARLIAGALAVAVAATTRNAILTIAAGMAALWVLQALLH